MKAFFTLMRRDLADNRGALLWTPLIIAAVLISLGLLGYIQGGAQFGFDPDEFTGGRSLSVYSENDLVIEQRGNGEVSIKTGSQKEVVKTGEFSITVAAEDGPVTVARGQDGAVSVTTADGVETLPPVSDDPGVNIRIMDEDGAVDVDVDGEDKAGVSVRSNGETVEFPGPQTEEGRSMIEAAVAIGGGFAGALPVTVTAVIILFLLAGSLYDERKDRSILFWKSMPVSDFSTVLSKLATIVGVGFGISLLTALALQLAISALGLVSAQSAGITGLSLSNLGTSMITVWITLVVLCAVYIGWALPVYGWILSASAFSSKSPFLAAFVPLAALPLIAQVAGLKAPLLSAPLRRLAGVPVFEDYAALKRDLAGLSENNLQLDLSDLLQAVTSSTSAPTFWIGLVIGVGLIFLASEIRRRRAS
ncbi:MAG: hypothetical protein KGS00_00435 [Alphaproteobacteria bacterium]|nr:hypothetical protein [Alphaproteobacteria bacterium]